MSAQVAVAIQPSGTALTAGTSLTLRATVTGTTQTAVTWSLGAPIGVIAATGVYTAPAAVSDTTTVVATARSVADPTRSASVTLTIYPNVQISIVPPSGGNLITAGETRTYAVNVSGTEDRRVTWSLSAPVGTINNGFYTAPASVTSGQAVTITATSVANPLRRSSVTAMVYPAVTISLQPSSVTLSPGQAQQLAASVSGSTDQRVMWSIGTGSTMAGIGGAPSGSTMGTITNTGLYTAPATVSTPTQVSVMAMSLANPTRTATVSIQLRPPAPTVTLSPSSATVRAGQNQSLAALVSGIADGSVNWSLNPAVGTLSPSGSNATYTAPATLDAQQTVEVTATSVADNRGWARAILTVLPVVAVTVAPASTRLQGGQTVTFAASVTGTTNRQVTWSLDPAVGSISSTGVYTAPSTIAAAQRVRVRATSALDPQAIGVAEIDLEPAPAITFRTGTNGLESLTWRGTEVNFRYGEQLLMSWRHGTGNTFVYGPACSSRTFTPSSVTQQCASGPAQARLTTTYSIIAPDTLTVDYTFTNLSVADAINEVQFTFPGITSPQYVAASSRTTGVNVDSAAGWEHYGTWRLFHWLETPGPSNSLSTHCGWSFICKHFAVTRAVAPGETRTLRLALRFTADLTDSAFSIVPEAYQRLSEAMPMQLAWPDRRPIVAWWIAEGTKKSAINPRGYMADDRLDASTQTFRDRVLARARDIRDRLNARPVRPQGLIIWDIEGQEFIHPTTYIGDPRVFESGYAAEMNPIVDQVFRTFTDAGYRVGVTIRPQFMEWGTQLPSGCTFDNNHDFKSYYIKVDNAFGQRFHACYDPAGASWSVIANGNGGQTVYRNTQIAEVTALLKSKIDYARNRWGATLFYIDSAVWSGGAPIQASIIRDLQRSYPDCLFIPEQESMQTATASIPYADPRVASDPRFAPLTWRWAYPTMAFAVSLQDCQGTCWSTNLESFRIGQKIGDIAIYANPIQMNLTHLSTIESMILAAREENSSVRVTDSSTGAEFTFRGDVSAQAPYPVKMRVYFGTDPADLAQSNRFCEAGQLMGENACTMDLTGVRLSQIRYVDFANRPVGEVAATPLR